MVGQLFKLRESEVRHFVFCVKLRETYSRLTNSNFTINSALKITYVPSPSLVIMSTFSKICKLIHIDMLLFLRSEAFLKQLFIFFVLLKLVLYDFSGVDCNTV